MENNDKEKDWIVKISKSDIGIRTVMIIDNHDKLQIFGIDPDNFDRFSKEMSKELIRIKYEKKDENES